MQIVVASLHLVKLVNESLINQAGHYSSISSNDTLHVFSCSKSGNALLFPEMGAR